MKPENWRHHAAGHLAAAESICREVKVALHSSEVSTPDAVFKLLEETLERLRKLEGWFVDPMNGLNERNG